MLNFVEREVSRDRLGWQERLHSKIGEAFVIEGAANNGGTETHLLGLLKYYQALVDGGPPTIHHFAPDLHAPALRSRVSYIDVAPEDPSRYVLQAHQPSPFLGVGEELTGRRVLDHPLQRNALSCISEYQRCARLAGPEYALIDQHLTNGAGADSIAVRRTFYRLLLPLVDLDGQVVKLAYSFRRIAIATPGVV